MIELTNLEIMRVVNRYIGVDGGYLGDFSYRTHADFYSEYCNLDIDPYLYAGTTRERFIEILKSQSPVDQAKILRGVLERFPLKNANAPTTRTQELQIEIRRIIGRLEQNTPVSSLTPQITSTTVQQALTDAEHLLESSGAASAVDRVHTAIYGYLKEVCNASGIVYETDATINRLLKLLRKNHPAFQAESSASQDMERIFQAFGTVLDSLNAIRNNKSLAHPNPTLLEQEEAMLAINATRTIFHYLNSKFQ